MKRVCVFCGSSPGARPQYVHAARELGRELAARSIGLVYGGAGVGVMREIAEAALAAGGEVTGVIPAALVEREVAFEGLSDLRVVDSMHDRKALMADLADGFVALPGGLGTLEEFLEVLTWAQLGIHAKPCGVLNVSRYFDPLIALLDRAVEERFISPKHRSMALVSESPKDLLRQFASYEPPAIDKAEWVLDINKT